MPSITHTQSLTFTQNKMFCCLLIGLRWMLNEELMEVSSYVSAKFTKSLTIKSGAYAHRDIDQYPYRKFQSSDSFPILRGIQHIYIYNVPIWLYLLHPCVFDFHEHKSNGKQKRVIGISRRHSRKPKN